MSEKQATKLISVVRAVPRNQAIDMGHEKAYALVKYTDATEKLLGDLASYVGGETADAARATV